LKISIAAGLLLATASAACAGDPGFCANYANAAVRQAHVAHMAPGCAPGAIGARWTENYRVHYSWCITAPYPAAESERGMRTSYLRHCR
jgi:hypothetical protein